MILSEFLGTQHRLLATDFGIRGFKTKKRRVSVTKVRWWKSKVS